MPNTGRGQSTHNLRHQGEYLRQMALDSSTILHNHPMSGSGDVPLCVDWRNVDPSVDGTFDLACMEDIFGGTEWIDRALGDRNICFSCP